MFTVKPLFYDDGRIQPFTTTSPTRRSEFALSLLVFSGKLLKLFSLVFPSISRKTQNLITCGTEKNNLININEGLKD